MQVKANSRRGTFYNTVVTHIVTEVIIVISIVVLYIGYGFIDSMFITKERERQKKMQEINNSILDYTKKIHEYRSLWKDILATGDDKRVISDFSISKIERFFAILPEKFDIKQYDVQIEVTDPVRIISALKISGLPKGVNLKSYDFKISGMFEVETDIYNMLNFLEVNLPGVVITRSIVVFPSAEALTFLEMKKARRLNVEIFVNWFFLTDDPS